MFFKITRETIAVTACSVYVIVMGGQNAIIQIYCFQSLNTFLGGEYIVDELLYYPIAQS